jgi:peptidoglycan hydrolase-like amidase
MRTVPVSLQIILGSWSTYSIGTTENATERKQSAVRYLSANVRELWKCTAAWDNPTRSYEDFKAEVYAFYPEATDAFRYTPSD